MLLFYLADIFRVNVTVLLLSFSAMSCDVMFFGLETYSNWSAQSLMKIVSKSQVFRLSSCLQIDLYFVLFGVLDFFPFKPFGI